MATFLKPAADLATYEHHLYVHLGWFCSECDAFIRATDDIRSGEESAPEVPWSWRHAREAREGGWFLPPTGEFCLCPQCARTRGFVMPMPRASA